MRIWQRVLFYIMSGIYLEVLFTSFRSLYYHKDYLLHGNTQLWVSLLYGLGGLIFEKVYYRFDNRVLRIFTYLVLVYVIEYTRGWILEQMLGILPWHRNKWGNIHGLVQLRYIPVWLIFAIIANVGIYYVLHYKFTRLKNIHILLSMSEKQQPKPWFFMREYSGDTEEPVETTVNIEEVEKLIAKMDLQEQNMKDIESRLTERLASVDAKLDKLIQSNKSLIAYFTAVSNRDARDLNYKIRSFASKKHFPPTGFVAEHIPKSDL